MWRTPFCLPSWHRISVALWFFGLAACRGKGASTLDAAPPPSLDSKATKESERERDPLWMRAALGDAIELAMLADREGASGLLEGLEEGGAIAKTALAALPFADDGELAFQRLGEILRQIDPGESSSILDAITEIAARPRRQTEPTDPTGLRFCAESLLELSQKQSAARVIRARAISALRLFAERNAVASAVIPTDLDTPSDMLAR